MDKNIEDWREGKRLAVECLRCGEIIYSKWSGQFVSCSCDSKGVFVDQTPYYVRIGYSKEKDYKTHLISLYK